MGAIGQKSFHFAFIPIEHLSDLFCIHWFHFLMRHFNLHAHKFFQLPGSTPPDETVFVSDEETIEEEKEHVPEFCKWDSDEHHFSCQNVECHHRIIVKPLVIGEIPCQERSDSDEKDEIVVGRRDGPDPGEKETAAKEIGPTYQHDQGQHIRKRFRKTEKVQSPGLIEEDIMSQEEIGVQRSDRHGIQR